MSTDLLCLQWHRSGWKYQLFPGPIFFLHQLWCSILVLWYLLGWVLFIGHEICTVPFVSVFRTVNTTLLFRLWYVFAGIIGDISVPRSMQYVILVWKLVRLFCIPSTDKILPCRDSESDRRHVQGCILNVFHGFIALGWLLHAMLFIGYRMTYSVQCCCSRIFLWHGFWIPWFFIAHITCWLLRWDGPNLPLPGKCAFSVFFGSLYSFHASTPLHFMC